MTEKGGWWSKVKNVIKEGANQTGKAWSYVGNSIIHGGKCYMCLKPANLDINCGHILCSHCLAYWIDSQGDTELDQIPCFICSKIIAFEFTRVFRKTEQDFNSLEEEKVPAQKIQKIPSKSNVPSKDSTEIKSDIPQQAIPSNNIRPPSGPIFLQPPPNEVSESSQEIKALNSFQVPPNQVPINKDPVSDDSKESKAINKSQIPPIRQWYNQNQVSDSSQGNKEELNNFPVPPMPDLTKKDSAIDSPGKRKEINKFQIPQMPDLLKRDSSNSDSESSVEVST